MSSSNFITQIRSLQPQVDLQKLKTALKFAQAAHAGQTRYSGEPYLNHALQTATILASWHLYTPSITAGLLHDTVEDGHAQLEDIQKQFGPTVALLVDGVTKVSRIKLRGSTQEALIENLRKMIVAMSKDLRVVLIKLADRLHNMRTLEFVPRSKQIRIARETLEVYAPLADRLGMGEIKGELEDLAFPFLHPQDYQWLNAYSTPYYKKAQKDINKAKKIILKKLAQEGIRAQVHGRAKHLYSLHLKLLRPEIAKDISRVHDIVAMRILVDTIPQCYTALGIVHKLYKPVPKLGISDFIAQPKPNGYRSIHTKVFLNGRIAEIQIRTHQMHEQAEYGVAAHFHYTQAKKQGANDHQLEQGQVFTPKDKLAWVKQLVTLHREIKDNQELVSHLKLDALSHRIFVFTPKGDVIDLPQGATPVDFAYAVHSDIGNSLSGAKVNGKLVSLDYHLQSGDLCQAVTSKTKKTPSRDWLDFVVTATAKRHLRRTHTHS